MVIKLNLGHILLMDSNFLVSVLMVWLDGIIPTI